MALKLGKGRSGWQPASTATPDRPFHNFTASKSQDRPTWCSSETWIKIVKLPKDRSGSSSVKQVSLRLCDERGLSSFSSFERRLLPDRPFRHFGASRSGDWRIYCSSGIPCDTHTKKTTLERAAFTLQLLMFVTPQKERVMFIIFFLSSFCQLLSPCF